MNRILPLSILMVLASAARADAANLAVITNPPTIVNLLVFVGAVACAGGAIKVFGLVRGGRLSKSWQLFIVGFILLAVSEIILLCQTVEVLTLPEFVVPTLLAAMAVVFLFGILEVKKTLG